MISRNTSQLRLFAQSALQMACQKSALSCWLCQRMLMIGRPWTVKAAQIWDSCTKRS